MWTLSHSYSASVLPFAQLKSSFTLWNLMPAIAGKRYLLFHVACGGAYTFWAYSAFLSVSVSSIFICLYVGDGQPRGTMHSSPEYTTIGNRDTETTALHRPVSQWWCNVDNSDKRFRVTPVTHLQALVFCRCYLNTRCIKRLLFCANTLYFQ